MSRRDGNPVAPGRDLSGGGGNGASNGAPDRPPRRVLTPDSPFVNELIASPNIGERRNGGRPRFLILHYTGLESFQHSIDVLRNPVCEVSCHYVVDVDGHVVQMVSEADRAWHAGLSCWQGETDINSWSIGIEIQNPGHDRGYPDFAEAQMQAVENLAGDIIARRKIRPEHVLAHSDIAPHRKNDPGEKFDWQRLAQKQIGHWVPSRSIAAERPTSQSMSETGTAQDQAQVQDEDRVRHCQALLRQYGYEVACDGMLDDATRRVIIAFQRHFRPARIDGLPDRSTIATLEDLLAALNDLDAPTPTV